MRLPAEVTVGYLVTSPETIFPFHSEQHCPGEARASKGRGTPAHSNGPDWPDRWKGRQCHTHTQLLLLG